MFFYYSFSQHIPLAEFTEYSGTFRTYAANMYRHIDLQQRYGSLLVREYAFHFLNADSLTFLCLCRADLSPDLAFGYLNEVYMQFITVFGDIDVIASLRDLALPFELSKAMRGPLRRVNRKYAALSVSDAEQLPIAAERAPLVLDEASLKTEMKCALLVHRSTHSRAFRLQSERAPPAILAKYPFLMVGICIAISIVVFVYIVVAIGCGATFERCIDGGFQNTTMPVNSTDIASTTTTMMMTTMAR
jgi:hypothetical protein